MSTRKAVSLPNINDDDHFNTLTQKLGSYIIQTIERPFSFDDLRKSQRGLLSPLVHYLYVEVRHNAVTAALMALRGHFSVAEDEDDEGVNASRSTACEVIAIRYVNRLSEKETIDSLLYELPEATTSQPPETEENNVIQSIEQATDERSPLLGRQTWRSFDRSDLDGQVSSGGWEDLDERGLSEHLAGLNALEIAAVSGAKRFLSQRTIQRTVIAIWDGDIVFWSSLSNNASKQVQMYRKTSADPYSRLRVPKYLKAFEVMFFAAFLVIYYIVLVQRVFDHVTPAEVLLYLWLISFAHNELGEVLDAGTTFYLSDFWALWDLGIVAIGAAFFVCRMIGLANGDRTTTDTSFDILSMEALVLVPRICSLLSLHPYFGTLLPCLRVMTKDFLKFLSLVVILYLGFLTTFSLLARGHFTFKEMSWILIKVFFGSSYLGFDTASEISPFLGPPLMFIFVCLTNILLITSLISILSNSLTQIIEHARDEYLFVYSVFVLEASTSNRLTYFVPPLNLIPLVLRPLRLLLPATKLRALRIFLLKTTHFPHVCAINVYEYVRRRTSGRNKVRLPVVSMTPKAIRQRRSKRYSRNRLSTPLPPTAANLRRDTPQLSLRKTADIDHGADARSHQGLIESTSIRDIKSSLDSLRSQIDALTQKIEMNI